MKSIRTKIAILMASTSIILILGILSVTYAINRKNIVSICTSYLYDTCMESSVSPIVIAAWVAYGIEKWVDE